nr:pre-mrna-processing factor 19 [Quercus suber]
MHPGREPSHTPLAVNSDMRHILTCDFRLGRACMLQWRLHMLDSNFEFHCSSLGDVTSILHGLVRCVRSDVTVVARLKACLPCEAPQEPVASRKSGTVFEKRLIESYISENGTDPVTGEELTTDDLIELKQSRVIKPRPPTLTSIPALLSTFQNEWDAIVLETYQLKQQLSQTRQELSTSLYYNDAAQRVIARVSKERDEARDALSKVTVNARTNGNAGEAMDVDGQGLSEAVIERVEHTQQKLQATRRKRPVPEDWATSDVISTFDVKSSTDTQFTGASFLAADKTGELFLCGDSDGTLGIFDLKQATFTTRSNLGAGALLAGTWANDKAVVATSSGAVVVSQEGSVQSKFQQHAGAATAIAAHPCGDLVASVGEDKSYILYDLQDGKVLTQVFSDSGLSPPLGNVIHTCGSTDIHLVLTTVSFHPDGHLLAAGAADGSIKLFDVKTSQLAHTFPAPSGADPVISLDFSENGTWLASTNKTQSSVTVWHLGKLNVLKTIDVGTEVVSASWDYTGQFLAVTGPGGVTVIQYSKSSKSWSEPLKKSISGVDVKWGAHAASLATLTSEGAISLLSA